MIIQLHPQNPEPRLIVKLCHAISAGELIAYPTESGYALGCKVGAKHPLQRIERIRNLEPHHHFSLLCRDLSEIARFAKVDNPIYRFLKQHTPGPYTFILQATHELPKLLMHPKKKTIGIRISRHIIPQMLTETLQGPITASSLILPGENYPLQDAEEIDVRVGHAIDWIIDLGTPCPMELKTVVDCTSGSPVVLEG